MKLPRDISGADLTKALRALDYAVTRQKGSHIRLTTERDGTHHETIPAHSPLKLGTLHHILQSVAAHHQLTLEDVIAVLKL